MFPVPSKVDVLKPSRGSNALSWGDIFRARDWRLPTVFAWLLVWDVICARGLPGRAILFCWVGAVYGLYSRLGLPTHGWDREHRLPPGFIFEAQ